MDRREKTLRFNLILGFSLNETTVKIEVTIKFGEGFNLILGFSLNETGGNPSGKKEFYDVST